MNALIVVIGGGIACLLAVYKLRIVNYVLGYISPSPTTILKGHRTPVTVQLTEKQQLTHDTVKFIFKFSDSSAILGLPIGNCIFVDAVDSKGKFSRAYTPVSLASTKGSFDLVVKIYSACKEYPSGGRMSQYLSSLPLFQYIHIRGPFGLLSYDPSLPGEFHIKKHDKRHVIKVRKVGLVAGGSGITPMYQIINALMNVSKETISITLLFCNKTMNDIILFDELVNICATHPAARLQVQFLITDQQQNPTGADDDDEKRTILSKQNNMDISFEHLSKDSMIKYLPKPSEDTFIAICGPPLMISQLCLPSLADIGHSRKSIYAF